MSASFNRLVVSFLNTHAKLETIAADLRAHFEDPTDRRFVRDEVLTVVAARAPRETIGRHYHRPTPQ